MTGFADFLRRERERRGWTMSRLAAESGLSHITVSRYESGTPPTRKSIVKITHGLAGSDEALQAILEAEGLSLAGFRLQENTILLRDASGDYWSVEREISEGPQLSGDAARVLAALGFLAPSSSPRLPPEVRHLRR